MLRWVPTSLDAARRRRILPGRDGAVTMQRLAAPARGAQDSETEAQAVEAQVSARAQAATAVVDPEQVASRVMTRLLQDLERERERIG